MRHMSQGVSWKIVRSFFKDGLQKMPSRLAGWRGFEGGRIYVNLD